MNSTKNALAYYKEISRRPFIPSGDKNLDSLLNGGFLYGPANLLFGNSIMLTAILQRIALNFILLSENYAAEVIYIDGKNRFDPYFFSKMGLRNRANPEQILRQIKLARCFTWNQMVEAVEEKIYEIDRTERNYAILIDGITADFEDMIESSEKNEILNKKPYYDLNRMFYGIKSTNLQDQIDPLIVMTTSIHPKSKFRPSGGKIMSHFAGVIVGISQTERRIEYNLHQHPFLASKSISIRRNTISKRKKNTGLSQKNRYSIKKLDHFFIK